MVMQSQRFVELESVAVQSFLHAFNTLSVPLRMEIDFLSSTHIHILCGFSRRCATVNVGTIFLYQIST